jgi:hypothetical protein
LGGLVVHSRAVIAAVELGERWPTRELAVRCDEVLHTGGALVRLWPLVDAERRAVRRVVASARLSDLREEVLRLAVLTGTDLSALSVADTQESAPGNGIDDGASGASVVPDAGRPSIDASGE